VLCSGKVYYDLYDEREKRGIDDIYLMRVEQLYPVPLKALVHELHASRAPNWSGVRKSRAIWARGTSSSPISNGC
jgi:2-oxoglutarate dehydrogenase complex dehydrogenase (E1) component-like enzyme